MRGQCSAGLIRVTAWTPAALTLDSCISHDGLPFCFILAVLALQLESLKRARRASGIVGWKHLDARGAVISLTRATACCKELSSCSSYLGQH